VDRGPDPLGDRQRRRRVGVRQEQRELVAAVAEDAIGIAAGGDDRPADLGEQPVAGLVAQRVVDALKSSRSSMIRLNGSWPSMLRRSQPGTCRGSAARSGRRSGPGSRPPVDLGVLEGDRDLGREQLDELELLLRVAMLEAQALERQHAGRAVPAAQRDDDQAAVDGARRGSG
jgi:hypothetical protein